MIKRKILFFVLAFLFCVPSAIAGPFGLKIGMSLNDINKDPKKMVHPTKAYFVV